MLYILFKKYDNIKVLAIQKNARFLLTYWRVLDYLLTLEDTAEAQIFKLFYSHKKKKHGLYCRYFRLSLKYLGWLYREHIKTVKNGGFCEELLSENHFEAVLATFCCYEYGGNASEAVQKIAADQKDYPKCSSCVIVR